MEALKKLYVAICDNKVVAYGTNLKDFVQELNDIGVSDRNYQYFYRQFEDKTEVILDSIGGVSYHLQRVK